MILEEMLSPTERERFSSLTSPLEIQKYLDHLTYVNEERNRSPLAVIRDRQSHCLDGGLLASAALRRLGYPPLLVDLVPEPGTDDDHVLAIFKHGNRFGALAKSNFPGLRYRDPIYRSVRELAMSYFPEYFNAQGVKTMRAYTRPLNLTRYDRIHWEWDETGVNRLVKRFYSLKPIHLLDESDKSVLSLMDERAFTAGMVGVDPNGMYRNLNS